MTQTASFFEQVRACARRTCTVTEYLGGCAGSREPSLGSLDRASSYTRLTGP